MKGGTLGGSHRKATAGTRNQRKKRMKWWMTGSTSISVLYMRIPRFTVLNELFRRFEVALVYEGREKPTDIITRIDLIDYIATKRS